MRLTNVTPADSMEVAGFAQHTMTCPGCGDVEQRLVFSQRPVRTEAPPVEIPIEAPIAALMAASVEMAAPIAMEAPIRMDLALPVEGSPLAHVPATARPGRDQERAHAGVSTRQERVHARLSTHDRWEPARRQEHAPLTDPGAVSEGTETALTPADNAPRAEGPVVAPRAEAPAVRKAWAQATERLQRRTAIAQETTGETVANVQAPAPAKAIRDLDDFDRLWESLAQPLPPPAPSIPISASPAHDEPVGASSLAVSMQPMTWEAKPHVPAEPARLSASRQDEAPPQWRPVAQPLASPVQPAPERPSPLAVFRHAWTRAAEMLRGKPVASKPERTDAMLQVDAGPLKW
jgi:hypothetical protein